MSGPSSVKPLSNNVNSPQIPSWLYLHEKTNLAGSFIAAIFYGIIITLFFKCMGALLNPVNRINGGVKWGLVAHTLAMFSFATILNTMSLNSQSGSYVDNREFPGVSKVFPPGPVGYQESPLVSKATTTRVSIPLFPFNQWLLDGLLLYRCYIIYSMNYWIIAFPCLIYFASVATGIAYIYEAMQPESGSVISQYYASLSYYSICVALNALLTLMIVIRLVLHIRNIRDALGPSAGVGGLYTAIIAMLIESHAPYAIAFLLYIGPWATNSPIQYVFSPILCEMQVIAPFLIILRVANRRALTSNIITGTTGSIRFVSEGGTMDDNGTLTNWDHVRPMETTSEAPSKVGVGVENPVEVILL